MSARAVFDDPQVVLVDGPTPFTNFDGQAGSILIGRGWGARESISEEGDWQNFSWVTGKEAKLYFTGFFPPGMVFYARCLPFSRELYLSAARSQEFVSPPQSVTIVLNGQAIGSRALKPEWQGIRIPIPGDLIGTGLQELSLQFRYATKPSAISDKADSRDLAAAFSQIAILPEEIQDPPEYIEGNRSMMEEAGFALRAGAAAEIPLQAGANVALRLGPVDSGCRQCLLSIEFQPFGGDAKILWEGKSEEASNLTLTFSTPPAGIGYLRFRLIQGSGAANSDKDDLVRVGVPENFLTSSYSPNRDRKRPNIFLYLIDTLRADEVARYGTDYSVTPEMEEFARDAVTYLNARSASGWTLPSVVSLLTGTYARTHGIMKGDRRFQHGGIPVLPLILSQSGYTTLGVSQSSLIGDDYGISDLFERFFLSDHLNTFSLRSQAIRKFLVQWLRSRGQDDRPIFAYFHTVDPHAPYTPPNGFEGLANAHPGKLSAAKYHPATFMAEGIGADPQEVAHLKGLYQGEVMYADREFGRFVDLLKHLNLYEDSFIILTSDHGEEFGEHGGFDHGRSVYDEILRVPLIVKYPRSQGAGSKLLEPVSTIDIVPTVLQNIGLKEYERGFDGKPLPIAPRAMSSRVVAAELEVFASDYSGAVNYRAFIQGDLKCIQNLSRKDQFGQTMAEWQSFDLSADPGERDALAPSTKQAARCRDLAQLWLGTKQGGGETSDFPAAEATQETLQKLRSLGYIK